MTVAFTAEQIDAILKRLAASSAKTAEERSKVNFGEGEQPQSRVLNQWLSVGFPADAMLAMHRCGFGKAETIGIYLGAKGDPEPESFLLAWCKMMNPAGTDAGKTIWHECQYAINLITDTYSPNWWVHAMRNLQLRMKNILDRDAQAALHAEKHPDAVPVVPKGDRRTQYLRIQQELPSIWDMYETRCNPHHRILDKLDQVLKQNLSVPVWKPHQMWVHSDPISTTIKNESAFALICPQ